MKYIKKYETYNILNVGDHIRITSDKDSNNIYRIHTYEPEFISCPYGVRNIQTNEFRTPHKKYIVKIEDYELQEIKYNL